MDFRERTDAFQSILIEFKFDNLDRLSFPRQGIKISAKSEWATRFIQSPTEFTLNAMNVYGAYEVAEGFSLFSSISLGISEGSGLPPHYQFFMGGAYTSPVIPYREHSFWGMNIHDMTGRYLRIAQVGFQSEIDKNKFFRIGYNLGEITDTFELYPRVSALEKGGMVAIGANTAVGPIELMLSRSTKREFIASINVGYRF